MHSVLVGVGDGLVAQCWVCGQPACSSVSTEERSNAWRCEKHAGRNPCAIEGCSRSTAADGRLEGNFPVWICGAHWKIGVPPRSMMRRQYHRYFRLAKRHGWDAIIGSSALSLNTRFWHFWSGVLIPRARERCSAGDIDVAEINRLFGWDET